MAKRPKIRLSLLNSLQFCRPKPSSLPICPLSGATVYMFSSIKSKSFDISFPNFPQAPPCTPKHPSDRPSRMSPHQSKSYDASSSAHSQTRKNANDSLRNTYNSRELCRSDDSRSLKKLNKNKNGRKKPGGTRINAEADSSHEETEKLFSSASSMDFASDDLDYYPLMRTIIEEENVGKMKGKVKESFVVEKRSEDPYEDFKRSMLEMILEKHIFEAAELEQLLMCLISLNSQHHHAVIVKAFMEIWEEVFS